MARVASATLRDNEHPHCEVPRSADRKRPSDCGVPADVEGGVRVYVDDHAPAFSEAQVRLLGLAELVGAIGLVAPTATGIAPYLSRVAAAGLATLMGGAVATLAVQRKSAIFPTVVALVLIAVATVR